MIQGFKNGVRDVLGEEWTVEVSNARSYWARCSDTRKIVRVARQLATQPDEVIHEVLAHELCHALAGCHHMHGQAWKDAMAEWGYPEARVTIPRQ